MADMINVYPALANDPNVTYHVADQIFPDVAPQDATPPFIVWRLISNVAYNSLSCVPDADSQRIQVDCYARKPEQARNLAFVVRNSLQATGTVIDGPTPDIEPDTRLYRWSMDCLYFHKRVS